MRSHVLGLLLLAASFASAQIPVPIPTHDPVGGTVISFENGTLSDDHDTYTEGGITITSTNEAHDHVHIAGGALLNHPFNDGEGREHQTDYMTYHFDSNGVPFTLVSISILTDAVGHTTTFRSATGAEATWGGGQGVLTFPAEGWMNITSFDWLKPASAVRIDDVRLSFDTTPPVVTILSPTGECCTSQGTVHVVVRIEDASATTTTTDPETQAWGLPAGGGTIEFDAPLVNEGPNVISFLSTDASGNGPSAASVTIVRDTTPPELSFTSPSDGSLLGTQAFEVTLSVHDEHLVHVTFEGNEVTPVDGVATASHEASVECEPFTLTANATDCAGNETIAHVTIEVDYTAPVVAILDPVGGTSWGPNNLAEYGPGWANLPVSASVDEKCESTLASIPDGVSGSLPEGGGVIGGAVRIVEGSNTIMVFATDHAGHIGSASVEVFLDTTPPIAEWSSPRDGACVRGTLDLSASASDPGTGIASVTVSVDGGAAQPMAPADGGSYGCSIDTTTLGDGQHTLRLRAVDGIGNWTERTIAIIVDNTPPDLHVVTPGDGDCFCNGDEFAVTAFDATCGLDRVVLSANGTPVATFDGGAGNFSTHVTTTQYPDGSLALTATATDHVGNSATVQLTVQVDNSAPEKSFVSPVNGQTVSGTITIEANVSDPHLKSVEFLVDGVSLGVMTAGPFRRTYDTLGVLDGAISITLVAKDCCDNTSTETMQVYADNLSFILNPQTLNLGSQSGDKSVTAYVEGLNAALLIPTESKNIRLVLANGSSVGSTAGFSGDDATGDYNRNGVPDLTIKFDRQAFIAIIKAGIRAGQIDPAKPLVVRLVAGAGREIGVTTIRIIP